MFLHIGENIYILKKDIIAILNAKTLNLKDENRFIEEFMKLDELENLEGSNAKSYIITCENKRNRKKRTLKRRCNIYFSNISPNTLLKRFDGAETRLEV